MTTALILLALAVLGYLQYRYHMAVLARIEDIDADVETIKRERARLHEFIRQRVTERVAEFKTGGGRERLRARLASKGISQGETGMRGDT